MLNFVIIYTKSPNLVNAMAVFKSNFLNKSVNVLSRLDHVFAYFTRPVNIENVGTKYTLSHSRSFLSIGIEFCFLYTSIE